MLVAKAVGVKNDHLEATQNGAVTASCFAPAEIAAFHFVVEAMDVIEVTDTSVRASQALLFGSRHCGHAVCRRRVHVRREDSAHCRVPADKIDPESALASAARMMANHRLAAPACRILEPAVASERMTITHYSSRK